MPEPDFEQPCQHSGMSGVVTTGNPPTWRCSKCGERVVGPMILPELMPEPDFETLAAKWYRENRIIVRDPDVVPEIAEQLRQVWNARGAADIDAFKGADIAHKDPLDQRPDAEDIRRAIRALDR